MDWLKKNYDRVILLVASAVTIWLGATLIMKANGFAENFTLKSVTERNDPPENRQPEVKAATETLRSKGIWTTPTIDGKRPPLFISVPIVEKDGKIFDMTKEEPLLRPPASNAWLVENDLEFLREDVLSRDPDGDGFDNREEWEGKTSPRDAKKHPSRLVKLDLLRVKTYDYIVEFTTRNDPEYGINRRHPGSESWFKKVGETFENGRFRVDAFEEKYGVSNLGVRQDQSILKISDLQKGQKFDLVRNVRKNLPTYAAIFRYSLGTPQEFEVKVGETFKLPEGDPTNYKLIDLDDAAATITSVPAPGSGVEPVLTRIEKGEE